MLSCILIIIDIFASKGLYQASGSRKLDKRGSFKVVRAELSQSPVPQLAPCNTLMIKFAGCVRCTEEPRQARNRTENRRLLPLLHETEQRRECCLLRAIQRYRRTRYLKHLIQYVAAL